MPTPTKGPRLGGGPAHERHILANLATSLFEHGRITTTEAKAKRLRPLAERLITFAKRGDLAARRRVLQVVRDKGVVHELFTEIGPRFENRPGGYTRIVKIGPRKGDNAPMAVIELVEGLTVAQTAVREAEGATRRSARDRFRPGRSAAAGAGAAGGAQAAVAAADEAEAAAGEAADAEALGDVEAATEAAEAARDAAEEATAVAEAEGTDEAAEAAGEAQAYADLAEQAAENTKDES